MFLVHVSVIPNLQKRSHPFEDTKGRLLVVGVSINWPSNRNWPIKVLDDWRVSQWVYFVRQVFTRSWRSKCKWGTFHVSEETSMYLRYLPCIWDTFHVSEETSMYLRYLPCIWGTFHVSEVASMYQVNVSEVPSMYLRYLPCIWGSFHVSSQCIWGTFHVSEVPSMYLRYLPCIWGTFHVSRSLSATFRQLPGQ